VLGLAFINGKMEANALFDAAFLDELWQAEKWGSDWEAEDRRVGIKSELADAERFLQLVRMAG
jgi:chaperone required for assembly of F1-ATPase